MKTLILGMGNPILSDDGVGLLAAEKLRDRIPETDVASSAMIGLSLFDLIIGYDTLFIIDAMTTREGKMGELKKIGEDDRYYREWIGLLILLASEEYQSWLAKVTPAEIKFWCRAQWYVSPDCLSDEALSQVKDKIAPDVLAYYLHILSRLPKPVS